MPTTEVRVDATNLGLPTPKRSQQKSVRVSMTVSEWQQAHRVADALGLSLNETIRRLLDQAASQLHIPQPDHFVKSRTQLQPRPRLD